MRTKGSWKHIIGKTIRVLPPSDLIMRQDQSYHTNVKFELIPLLYLFEEESRLNLKSVQKLSEKLSSSWSWYEQSVWNLWLIQPTVHAPCTLCALINLQRMDWRLHVRSGQAVDPAQWKGLCIVSLTIIKIMNDDQETDTAHTLSKVVRLLQDSSELLWIAFKFKASRDSFNWEWKLIQTMGSVKPLGHR